MPYIKQDKRKDLDILVQKIADQIVVNGDLNYVLFALCKRYIKPSYNNYKNFIGELNECVAEIRRSILAQYEDEKRKESGDV